MKTKNELIGKFQLDIDKHSNTMDDYRKSVEKKMDNADVSDNATLVAKTIWKGDFGSQLKKKVEEFEVSIRGISMTIYTDVNEQYRGIAINCSIWETEISFNEFEKIVNNGVKYIHGFMWSSGFKNLNYEIGSGISEINDGVFCLNFNIYFYNANISPETLLNTRADDSRLVNFHIVNHLRFKKEFELFNGSALKKTLEDCKFLLDKLGDEYLDKMQSFSLPEKVDEGFILTCEPGNKRYFDVEICSDGILMVYSDDRIVVPDKRFYVFWSRISIDDNLIAIIKRLIDNVCDNSISQTKFDATVDILRQSVYHIEYIKNILDVVNLMDDELIKKLNSKWSGFDYTPGDKEVFCFLFNNDNEKDSHSSLLLTPDKILDPEKFNYVDFNKDNVNKAFKTIKKQIKHE